MNIRPNDQSHSKSRSGAKLLEETEKHLRRLKKPETSRSQIENTMKEDLEEGGYEIETSSEDNRKRDRSSSIDSSFNNEEDTN